MRVAVIGAGALGSVYGVRLAVRGGVDITFVVRPARVAETTPITIEAIRRNVRESIPDPARADAVPGDADVVLLAVGTEDLEALAPPLATTDAPIVVLTPVLPKAWAALRAAYGARVFAALPTVIAYTRKTDGIVRYWLPPAATKIDEPRRDDAAAGVVAELVDALGRAGLRARVELGVHETNPATTVSFIAIGMALCVAGSAAALAKDDALGELASRACREGVRLAHRIGTPEPLASLAPALASPWALELWLGALARLSPEAIVYAEEHFGRKLVRQHQQMAHDMIELAREKGVPHAALVALAEHLEAAKAG